MARKVTKRTLQLVFRQAAWLMVMQDYPNRSVAMKQAWWQFHGLRKMLSESDSPIYFNYIKSHLVRRHAIGTLNMALIPEEKHPKGTRPPRPEGNILNYYDIERQDWRSCDLRTVDLYPTPETADAVPEHWDEREKLDDYSSNEIQTPAVFPYIEDREEMI